MYEKSKEKYAADMEEYTFNKSINAVQPSNLPLSQWKNIISVLYGILMKNLYTK